MFDPPGQYIGAGVVALLTGGCLGSLYNARVAYREWSLAAAARAGLPWTDGRWTAVAGEIHPIGEPLIAPFSGEPCVLCEYDVTTQKRVRSASENENSNPGSDFAGFLMNPCAVRSDMGEVRILGFPNLEGFGERICNSSAAADNAKRFFAETEFENFSGLKLVTVVSAITGAWSDDDGLVRKNLRLGKTMPSDLFPTALAQDAASTSSEQSELLSEPPTADLENKAADDDLGDEIDDELDDDFDADGPDDHIALARRDIPQLKEKRVKVGEKVCAIGIYSGARGGLIPGGLGADHFIKLIRGRIADIERQSRSSTFSRFFGGLIFLLVVNAATYGVMLAARRDAKPATREAWQIVDGNGSNAARLKKLLGRGVDVNGREGRARTMLMEAAQKGNIEIVQTLIDSGADVNLRSADSGATALAFAIRGGNTEVAEVLRRAGAAEDAATPEQP
jgi:hypothetical protein